VSITSPRRFYLLKRRAATDLGEFGLASLWQAKQEAIYWPDLPTDFPARAELVAAGYTTAIDLTGADADELKLIGLTRSETTAVLEALETEMALIPKVLNGYQEQSGKFATAYDAPLFGSAARTASADGDAFEVGDGNTLRLNLVVTAASGTLPTLDVKVQTSYDLVTWRDVYLFGQKTTTTTGDRQSFSNLDRFVRAVATVGGTLPSFTFSLTGQLI